jgi:hypothetical protein
MRLVDIVSVSRLQNRNLAAQRGLFLLDRTANFGPKPTRTLDEVLEACVSGAVDRGILPAGSRAVEKFCLPAGERSALLDLLRKLGIDRAHLMPSFDGVVKELEARRQRRAGRMIPRVGESA